MTIAEFLEESHYSNHSKQASSLYNEYHNMRQEVTEVLKSEFPVGKELSGDPMNAGSWQKNTAVNRKFDLDILAPFKFRDKQKGAQKIKGEVYNVMRSHFGSRPGYKVRDQRVSTGISFQKGGELIEIDVVTGMEPREGFYLPEMSDPNDERKDLILFDRYSGQKIKTNVHRQIRIVKNDLVHYHTPIRLLKTWKKVHDQHIGSYAIELIAHLAYKAKGAPKSGSPDKLLRHILEYSIDLLPDLKLVDLGVGREWTDFLNPNQRNELKGEFKRMLKALDPNAPDFDLIRKLFPVNKQYPKPKGGQSYGSASYA